MNPVSDINQRVSTLDDERGIEEETAFVDDRLGSIEIQGTRYRLVRVDRDELVAEPPSTRSKLRLVLRVLTIVTMIASTVVLIYEHKKNQEEDNSFEATLAGNQSLNGTFTFTKEDDDDSNLTWPLLGLVSSLFLFLVDFGSEVKATCEGCKKNKIHPQPQPRRIEVEPMELEVSNKEEEFLDAPNLLDEEQEDNDEIDKASPESSPNTTPQKEDQTVPSPPPISPPRTPPRPSKVRVKKPGIRRAPSSPERPKHNDPIELDAKAPDLVSQVAKKKRPHGFKIVTPAKDHSTSKQSRFNRLSD